MRSNVSSVPVPLDEKYSWQILRGKDGTHATAWALRAAQVGSLFCSANSLYHSLSLTSVRPLASQDHLQRALCPDCCSLCTCFHSILQYTIEYTAAALQLQSVIE